MLEIRLCTTTCCALLIDLARVRRVRQRWKRCRSGNSRRYFARLQSMARDSTSEPANETVDDFQYSLAGIEWNRLQMHVLKRRNKHKTRWIELAKQEKYLCEANFALHTFNRYECIPNQSVLTIGNKWTSSSETLENENESLLFRLHD